VQRERAIEVADIEGAGRRPATGGDKEVAVGLFDRFAVGVDGDGAGVRVDSGHLVATPEVDPAVVGLGWRQRQQVAQLLDAALDEVGHPTVGIREPPALLEDDDLSVGVDAAALAGGTQAGGVGSDDDKRITLHARWLAGGDKRITPLCIAAVTDTAGSQ